MAAGTKQPSPHPTRQKRPNCTATQPSARSQRQAATQAHRITRGWHRHADPVQNEVEVRRSSLPLIAAARPMRRRRPKPQRHPRLHLSRGRQHHSTAASRPPGRAAVAPAPQVPGPPPPSQPTPAKPRGVQGAGATDHGYPTTPHHRRLNTFHPS